MGCKCSTPFNATEEVVTADAKPTLGNSLVKGATAVATGVKDNATTLLENPEMVLDGGKAVVDAIKNDPKKAAIDAAMGLKDAALDVNLYFDGIPLDALGAVAGTMDPEAIVNARKHTEFYRGDAPRDQKEWMKSVDPAKNVCDLWIPGTHDTMSDSGGDIAECQSWSLGKQLEAGVRALDIRLHHNGDKLQCCHGMIDMWHEFHVVVSTVETFLAAHPSEVIFMHIKRDNDSGTHPSDFDTRVRACITQPHLWNFGASTFGTLADHRGKVFALQPPHSSLRLFVQPADTQNEYTLGNPKEKFAKVKQHAGKARVAGTMFINYTSSVGWDASKKLCFKCPGSVAYDVNRMVMDECDNLKPGMYFMDFPGAKLMKDMIALNN